jgi:hypothetical protein
MTSRVLLPLAQVASETVSKVKELTEAEKERLIQAALRRRECQRAAYTANPDKKREYSRLYKQAKKAAQAAQAESVAPGQPDYLR